ncbi:unnamed protein product [Paramecium sonneborni]|uniref:Transmembrane protein n=1 Tax=Paramecium sonneborni TaxID=65129 RepID=A0A8S1RAX2_9CILI|nr:unnamed protein product [Paramecium sonneborni]
MKQNILALVIITFGALCLTQLTIQIKNQCECSQFDQSTCGTVNNQQSCRWNTTASLCEKLGCNQINNKTTCLQNFYECWWNGDYCQQFTSCSNLNSSQNLTCSQQNIQCGQNLFNSTTCVSLDNLPKCSKFNQTQCIPSQIGYQGSLCYWNNTSCQTATSCQQLSLDQCSQWQNTCIWNGLSNSCVQLQCSNFTYQSIKSLNNYSMLICLWIMFFHQKCQEFNCLKLFIKKFINIFLD